MKQLLGWATALRHKYESSIFSRTWWNIILFHTFFVVIMVAVFGVTLYYTKLTLFVTLQDVLAAVLNGGSIDPNIIETTADELNRNAYVVYAGIIFFSLVTSIAAAHITLGPTRKAFMLQKKFIGAIAHELRTPLAVLRTQNEVALYDVEPQSATEALIKENIIQIKQLTSILNNLLVFNRIDTSESIQFNSVDLEPVLHAVVARLEKLAAKRRIVIQIKIDPVPNIYGNSTAVEQAIYNVAKNAILYSKDTGGRLIINLTHEQGERAVVSIQDDGIGIAESKLVHIFEPFYRAGEDENAQKGSGLGLAIVFEIMKLHHGTIDVDSALGRGTTITLQFPLWNQHENYLRRSSDRSVTYDFARSA